MPFQADKSISALFAELPSSSRHDGWLNAGNRASGAAVAIPFVIVKGGREGPLLWINGQVHGNEVAAIVATLDLLNALDPAALSGGIVFTATGNPLALDGRSMFSPQDWGNLDQSFPGRPDGFITERLAHRLWREVEETRPDLLISMHAQGTEADSDTYAVFKQPSGSTVSLARIVPFVRQFSPFVVCQMRTEAGSGEIPGNHAGALDYQAMAHDIPAFMIELGTGLRARPEDVAEGQAAFRRVLTALGIQQDAPLIDDGDAQLVTRRGHVTVDHGGFFRATRKPGEIVPAGEPLGEVMDIHGRSVETVRQDHEVLIIAIRIDPVVHSGDNIAYVAHQWNALSLRGDGL